MRINLLCVALLFSSLSLADEENTAPQHQDEAVFFLLPGPVFGFYYFEYQKALSERHSYNLSIEYANPFYEGNHVGRYWAIYRYKLFDNDRGPLDGFFFAPAVHLAVPFDGSTLIANALLYGVYQYIQDNGLGWQLFVGAGYGGATESVEDYEMLHGFSPSIGLSVGYAF